MPKFINMVNGGSVEFPENGWHGIYGIDISFDRFVEHALKASKQWRDQRQWFDINWRAE